MKIFNDIVGNLYVDTDLAAKLADYHIERIALDQWTAQKSRFIVTGDHGTECAVALKRNHRLVEGDVLEVDDEGRRAIVASIELNPVFVIDLAAVEALDKLQIIQTCIELGHAIGNQHWPAVIKGTKVYVPLTVDRKVMQSVMDTHAIPGITYTFEAGADVIPYLAPHEIRNLFGGTSQESHAHVHAPGVVHDHHEHDHAHPHHHHD